MPIRTHQRRRESLWGKLKDWYKAHNPTSQMQTLGITKFKRGDGSTTYFTAKTTETKRLTRFDVRLAEELNDKYNTEHTLH